MIEKFGDCTVERVLGAGAMGTVYLVRSPDGERYALKVLNPEIARLHPEFKHRFTREAEFAMTLHHRNLIPVHDAGEDPERGFCYILMDYLPGGSVKERVCAQGRLPVDKAVSIAISVAGALEVAHYHGVVHRDIKSDNILFDADGTPKLADLGVARFKDDTHPGTMRGAILGTPAYMSPEQMLDAHCIDARADIYSLGVVLYEMLAGANPYERLSTMEVLARAIRGDPLPDVRTACPEVPAEVAYVLSCMVAQKPEDRPATVREVADLLERAVSGTLQIPEAKPSGAAEPSPNPFWRKPLFAVAMAALAVAVAALAFACFVWCRSQGS